MRKPRKHKGTRIPDHFRKKVGQRLRSTMRPYVKNDGIWTHCKETSHDLGINPNSVWFWYEGWCLPTIYNLVRFADYYEVSVDYLLGRVDKPIAIHRDKIKLVA